MGGEQAIKVLPKLKTAGGKSVKNIMVRCDIGCSDSQIYDKDTKWDPTKKTFFVNEIEPSSTTYFVRHLKFDSMPIMGRLYAEKAREIYRHMKAAGTTAADRMRAKAAKGKTTAKKTAPNAKTSKASVMKAGKLKAKASPKTASSKPRANTSPQAKSNSFKEKASPKLEMPKAKAARPKAKARVMKTGKMKAKVRA